jgi:hypothetical protein
MSEVERRVRLKLTCISPYQIQSAFRSGNRHPQPACARASTAHPAQLGVGRAFLIEMAGTSPAMTLKVIST